MISRELLIGLAITALTATILFLYFKKRLGVVEHKLNMMFQLIEEHNTQQKVQFIPHPQNVILSTNNQPQPREPENLIAVSDGENSDSESDDSDSDSDSENDSDDESDNNSTRKQINISQDDDKSNINIVEAKDIKLVNLNLNPPTF